MAVTDARPTPQMVGNAFVEQYYCILHQTPDSVYRFYHESSVLSRPEEDGSMTLVTSIEDINSKILSLDHTSSRVEILSADAQPSYKEGVMVVVTGYLTGNDNQKRKFVQSFFLAPQEKVYFVLNDIFRYVDEYELADVDPVTANDAEESAPAATFTTEPEPNPVPENIPVDVDPVPANDAEESAPAETFTTEPEPNSVPENIPSNSQTLVADTDTEVSKKVSQPLENEKLSATEVGTANDVIDSSQHNNGTSTENIASNTQEDAPEKSFASIEIEKLSATEVGTANHMRESNQHDNGTSTENIASNTQEDAPKKSFASIVNALKDNAAPFNVRPPAPKPVELPRTSVRPSASEASASSSDSALEKKKDEYADKSYAVFVANLPLAATVGQLEQVFMKFGPIKRDGVQVRSSKYQGSCFGFVEFESAHSMQSALEASKASPPITMDGRRLFIEERRATTNERARYSSGRGGYQNNNGNFNGNHQGYVRKDFDRRSEFSGRPRGNYQNGVRASQ